MTRLILFDVDGTLIRSHGAGRMALTAALEAICGTAGPIDDYKMSGKTDARIITDLLTAAGKSAAEINTHLPHIYAKMAEYGRSIFWEQAITACPGVEQLLPRLRQQKGIVLGLLTGNSSLTAPLKLAAAGINSQQFRINVFGSESVDRNALPGIARKRMHALTGAMVDGKNMMIVGDTPADILCARAGRATAVAVASGWHSAQTLNDYQPDFLLNDLRDTERVLSILTADHPAN